MNQRRERTPGPPLGPMESTVRGEGLCLGKVSDFLRGTEDVPHFPRILKVPVADIYKQLWGAYHGKEESLPRDPPESNHNR